MRIVVFSDIHGNAYALEAMLADLARDASSRPLADALVCLGDAIQGGPQPRETVARLRELDCPVVMGNSDDWLLTGIETDSEHLPPARRPKLNAIREWSLARLSHADREFIAAFQPTVSLPLSDGKRLLCFHGSPRSYDEILLPDSTCETFTQALGGDANTIYAGGHTHVQFTRRVGDTFHFNPGSVGFAYSHHQPDNAFHADAIVEYAVLTVEDARTGLEFRRVPYDAHALVEIYRASGRPYADEDSAQYD
jgi:predicted phosphodiesterase